MLWLFTFNSDLTGPQSPFWTGFPTPSSSAACAPALGFLPAPGAAQQIPPNPLALVNLSSQAGQGRARQALLGWKTSGELTVFGSNLPTTSLGDARATERFRGGQGLWNSQAAAGNGVSQCQQIRSGWDDFASRYQLSGPNKLSPSQAVQPPAPAPGKHRGLTQAPQEPPCHQPSLLQN